jgi:hypothetical protein
VTFSTRLPLLLGAALAASLAAAFAFFLLPRAESRAEQPADAAGVTRAAVTNPDEITTSVPAALQAALGRHEVVVVAWYAPLDAAVVAGARAGAQLAGAGFVPLNVMTEPRAVEFANEHDILHSPAVLVFTRGPKLRTRLPGTPDRDVVAQAAASAH